MGTGETALGRIDIGSQLFVAGLYRPPTSAGLPELTFPPPPDEHLGPRPNRGRDDGDETSRVENELSDGETPESLLASKEVAAAVNAAIDALSEDLRQAIVLREIEGLSYEEIASVMNCPIGTVRSRIFRAREAIAVRLRPLLGTRDDERW